MSNANQLAKLAAEYSAGIRAHYQTNPPAALTLEIAVAYATQDWLNQVRGWSIEEAADDLEYWKERWCKVAA